ncbi:hypothetical protein CRI70_15500 [Streptomyces sp. Ru87]|nr:hypothetical protein CRI70_18985 [Streptomyces sp. Ru87]PGH49812.1 hypothetical protein CRI70_15500 [Streptomyces sp. Ru87]
MTFGTLLSSQRTDASFEPVSGPSGRFPSVFPTLPDAFRPEFPADPQFQPPVGEGLCCAFRRGHHVSGFPRRLIIEPARTTGNTIPGTPESFPDQGTPY